MPQSSISQLSTPIYPTLYEILSAEEINQLISPSFQYILAGIIQKFPNKFNLKLYNTFGEWFSVLKFFVEYYHLTHWNSTFIEQFYGLKRFSIRAQSIRDVIWNKGVLKGILPTKKLTKLQILIILFENVILEYIVEKLNELHQKLLARRAFQNEKTKLKEWFIKWYPRLKKISFLLNLVCKLQFLSGKSGSTTIVDLLFGIEHTRLGPHDFQSYEKLSTIVNRLPRTNLPRILHLIHHFFIKVTKMSRIIGSQLFPTFIFILKIFQWWNAQNLTNKIQKKLTGSDKPIPPPPPVSHERTGKNCPICGYAIKNPAVIETGYVACYPCVIQYLSNNEGRCFITNNKLIGCQYSKEHRRWIIKCVRKLLV